MSVIHSMQIQGIRNFGPDAKDKQQVNFDIPLTLIVGQNGCGKTTIIECLKYITCGDMPPGCNRGASFVHDPKLAMESQILAQVKLKFRSTAGDLYYSVRSVEATQKPKKIEIKTVDATVTKAGDNTRPPESISSKCIDFENEMSDLLSVSKPIIENVIFCHQEESNWPLDEGKKVKEKFDAIFNATKYIKCLDGIKKLRKTLKEDVKKMDEILKERAIWKKEVDNKRKHLYNQEDTYVSTKEKHKQIQEEMAPVGRRIDEIRKIEEDLNEIRFSYQSKKGKLEAIRTAQNELREGQDETFSCSDMELRRMIQEFQHDVDKKDRELKNVQSDIEKVSRDTVNNSREIKRITDAKTNLEFAHKNHLARIKDRTRELQTLAKNHEIHGVSGTEEIDDNEAKTILSRMDEKIEEEQQNILAKKREFEKEENKIQSEVDSLRKKETSLEQAICMKEKQRENSKVKQRSIRMELQQNELDFSAHSLDDIKNELSQVEDRIKQQEKKLNIDKVKEEIDGIKRKRIDAEHRLEEKKRVVNRMNRQAQARSKLDVQVQEKDKLEQQVKLIKRKRRDEFEHLFPEVPEENIRNQLDALIANLKQKSSECREVKESLNRKKTMLDTRIENYRSDMKKKEEEVKGVDEKVMNVCDSQELEVALERSKEHKEQLTKDRGDLSSSILVLDRFTKKLKEEDCCPLCHRDFGTKEEIEILIQELEDKVKMLPQKLKDANQKLKKQEVQYEQMVALKPLKDQANKTRTIMDKLRGDIESNRKEVETIKNKLEENAEILDMTISDEEMAMGLSADVVTMDNHQRKIKQLKDQIEDLKTSLGSVDGDLTMDEAIKQQNDLDDEIKNYRRQESDLQDKLDEHKQELEGLKDRKLKLSSKELEIRTKLQETESLKEELKKLEAESATLEDEIEKAKEEVAPYKYQVERASEEKNKKTREKEKWMEVENAKLQTIRQELKSAKNLQSSIQEYTRSGKEERLEKSRQQLNELEETLHSLEARKTVLEEDQRQLEKDLSKQKERKRNLDDEKKIRDKEEEAKILETEIAKINSSIQDRNEKSIRDEKNELNVRYEKMYSERAKMEGSLKTIKDEIKTMRDDLNRKVCVEAEANYNNKFYEKMCTDLVVSDLDKYYTALDSAIMKFHLEKMQTINEIVRELWRTTYKGNDIDFIEIKSDEATSVGADKRRVFNYRVVMSKHGTEMDMRGRCSAGQKVLASLIIRLALAETFSLNCGILALDEPTTNLDKENVEALAFALAGIVEKRRHQKNFQLVVITHDLEFLQKLATRDYIDHYYKVLRNERGLSVIRRFSTESLG